MLFCSAPFRSRSRLCCSLAAPSYQCPSLALPCTSFPLLCCASPCHRNSGRIHRCATLLRAIPWPCCALPLDALAMPCHVAPSRLRAVLLLCRAVPRLCTAVPCFAIALRCNSFAYPLVSTQFRFRSNPSSALAVPVDATLRLCLQCFSDAGRGYANQCRCNSPRYSSSLFLCRSILCVAYAAHRVSSPSLIGAYPRPIKSYRLPGLSILRFASASQSAAIHFCSGA